MKLLCCSLMNSYSWIQWICYFTFVAIFFLMDMTHSTSITLWWSTCSLSIIWWQINKREIEPSSQVEATWGRLQTIHSQCRCWLCIAGGEILSCWYLQLSCSCSSKEIPKYQEGRAPVWVCHAQWTKIGWLKCFKYEAIQRGFNSFPVHQCLEHPLFDCFGPWFSLITWDQWIWSLQLCGTRGQCHTTSQSCRLTFAMSHAATGQFIYLMDDGCSSHLEMWNRAASSGHPAPDREIYRFILEIWSTNHLFTRPWLQKHIPVTLMVHLSSRCSYYFVRPTPHKDSVTSL